MVYGASLERPRTRYFALAEEETREPTVIDKLKTSALYRWGLVDDVYLGSKVSERELSFLTSVMSYMKAEHVGETALVVTSGVLTRNAFIEAAKKFNTSSSIDTWSLGTMLAPDVERRSALPVLIEKRILSTRTLWQNFLSSYTSHGQSFYNRAWRTHGFPWKYLVDVVNPDKISSGPNDHGIDAVESQALAKDVFRETEKSKLYPLDEGAHPLVKKLRGQENTARMSKQRNSLVSSSSIPDQYFSASKSYLSKRTGIVSPAGSKLIC